MYIPSCLTATDSTAPDFQALRNRLGERYFIERELGRGGMGTVYLARDVRLDRLVALKVLPPEFAVQATLRDRFLRETRTAASFSHPNIVPVYAVEESDDFLAYAMGYVEGESLMERVRRAGPLTVRETVKLMQDVAYALAYAHGRGIVHRDIKPDNIMMDRASGRALVMDFGIARAKSNAPASAAGLTRVGEVVGTPEYMSPEQASGDEVDGRSDLYSLGLAVMFALTGEQAVTAETTQKVLVKQLTVRLPSIATLRSDWPDALSAAVDRCVLKDPDTRFQTAEELVDALDVAQLAAPEIPVAIRLER
ncbi:MAG: serine/threonine protein kinase [Phycisphaerae bacterium]|nr:serine/threonine protein kinase [Gemmatimonadaceae bacterium]